MLLNDPAIATRSCDDCAAWMWGKDNRVLTRAGQPVPRPRGTKTPCWECPKTRHMREDQRTRENAVDLSARNWQAYRFWQMAKIDTTGLLFRDLVTLEVLAAVERVVQDSRESSQLSLWQLLLWRK